MANVRKATSPRGIGPVSKERLNGMRMYHRVLKQLNNDVGLREASVVEREYRYGRYRNPVLPVLMKIQKLPAEVLAGFAAMLSDLIAIQIDGCGGHDAKQIRKLLKTAVISKR